MDYSSAHQLARAIKESPECKDYHSLKEIVMEDETTRALIKEYRKIADGTPDRGNGWASTRHHRHATLSRYFTIALLKDRGVLNFC